MTETQKLELTDEERELVLAHRKKGEKVDLDDIRPGMSGDATAKVLAQIRAALARE